MFTRQYYYYQALKNFGHCPCVDNSWVPEEAERLLTDVKNILGETPPAGSWRPGYWSTDDQAYAYSFSIAANANNSLTTPQISGEYFLATAHLGPIIVIGTGDSTPTLDDYSLDAIIDSGVTRSTTHSIVFYDDENDKWYIDETAIFTRTAESQLTIKEWGIYANTGSSNNGLLCIYRALLTSPVTLNCGDSLKLSIRFTMDAHMA